MSIASLLLHAHNHRAELVHLAFLAGCAVAVFFCVLAWADYLAGR